MSDSNLNQFREKGLPLQSVWLHCRSHLWVTGSVNSYGPYEARHRGIFNVHLVSGIQDGFKLRQEGFVTFNGLIKFCINPRLDVLMNCHIEGNL